jgi:hypothetical protein
MSAKAPEAHPVHFWDLLESPKLSLTQVKARLRAGWSLFALPPEQLYCSAGGVGQYSCYVESPAGELAQLTDKSLAQLELSNMPAIKPLDQTALTLCVPFEEKAAAKALGARWDWSTKSWQVRPAHAEQCAKWLPTAVHAQNDF